jgi:hypothetical protein
MRVGQWQVWKKKPEGFEHDHWFLYAFKHVLACLVVGGGADDCTRGRVRSP